MASNETSPVVEISGLTKAYGASVAVDSLDLEVRRGEIFGILGTNGAGKTTSVECAQGLRLPDSGRVRVLGRDPHTERRHLRGRVGSQLQDSNLPDRLRVREAIDLFAADRTQASRIMSDWDLDNLAGKAFGDLSGGQKQRLFLALALLNDPEVVFLDELTQGLDPNARRDVWVLVEQVRQRGTTVVLVTHFMDEAETLCDRVTVMRQGRAIDSGTPMELIERHSHGVRLRFGGRPDDVDWLVDVPEVVDARWDRTELEVRGRSPVIAHVGAALVLRGAVPDEIRVSQPTLEDALLGLLETRQGAMA